MLHASRESEGTRSQDVNLCAVNAVGVNLWISGRKIVSVVLLCIPVLFVFWIETKKTPAGGLLLQGLLSSRVVVECNTDTPTKHPGKHCADEQQSPFHHVISFTKTPSAFKNPLRSLIVS